MSISVNTHEVQITVEEELVQALAEAQVNDRSLNELPIDFCPQVRTDMERECLERWLLVAELRDLAAAQRRMDFMASLV